jgi:hypothetical protein
MLCGVCLIEVCYKAPFQYLREVLVKCTRNVSGEHPDLQLALSLSVGSCYAIEPYWGLLESDVQ